MTPTFRICEECGAEFQKRPHQSHANFARQLCCSNACAQYSDPDCHICNGPHVLADHRRAPWFRAQVLRNIEEPAAPLRPTVGKPGFGRSPLIIADSSERTTTP